MIAQVSSWEVTASISQALATILTGIAVVFSIWLGVRSLREIEKDRVDKAKPYVLFDHGAFGVTKSIQEIWGILGINPAVARQMLGNSRGNRSFHPTGDWGRLQNYGTGSALHTRVQFLAYSVEVGNESFAIDEDKVNRFPYQMEFNEIPLNPGHIVPGGIADLFRIPTPIIVDFERKYNRIEFVLRIVCNDVYSIEHVIFQECALWVDDRDGEKLRLMATFGDEIGVQEASNRVGRYLVMNDR